MENMPKDKDTTKSKTLDQNSENDFPGYSQYPPSEDIYNRAQKESEIDPENITVNKTIDNTEGSNEKDFNEDVTGGDLDIPGAELDDDEESVGSEDEENNYYSIGGDNHHNLDED